MLTVSTVEGQTVKDADIICRNTIYGLESAEKRLEEIHQECILCRDRMECVTTKEHSWCQEKRKRRIKTQQEYWNDAAKFILENKDYILQSRGLHWQQKLRAKKVIDG
jgi:hypothetical protein